MVTPGVPINSFEKNHNREDAKKFEIFASSR